ncbi:hypothetical protein HHI36_016777 [Cryptolaemus montrouzieri]|uniref:Uncharacterized protein n=1 Tax=Cryptolaemus montrouzieri TaxID=559131 RepID=A0ABD2NL25_9CUCU
MNKKDTLMGKEIFYSILMIKSYLVKAFRNDREYWKEGIIKGKLGNCIYKIWIPEKALFLKKHIDQLKKNYLSELSVPVSDILNPNTRDKKRQSLPLALRRERRTVKHVRRLGFE